jgi:hypothetical protein
MVESDARGGWWKRARQRWRMAGAEVGGLGEVVVAGCSFMLMAIEKYEVRYSMLSSLGDSLAESHSSRFPEIRFARTRASVRAVSKYPHSSLVKLSGN